jgi:hypothetical protein
MRINRIQDMQQRDRKKDTPNQALQTTSVTRGGFGDGTYPVYQLVSSRKVVGLEVEFIKESDTYPF